MSYAQEHIKLAEQSMKNIDDNWPEVNTKELLLVAQTHTLMSIAYSLLKPEPPPDTQGRMKDGSYQKATR